MLKKIIPLAPFANKSTCLFHLSSHPSYSAYVGDTLNDMISTGRTAFQDLENFQNQLR